MISFFVATMAMGLEDTSGVNRLWSPGDGGCFFFNALIISLAEQPSVKAMSFTALFMSPSASVAATSPLRFHVYDCM